LCKRKEIEKQVDSIVIDDQTGMDGCSGSDERSERSGKWGKRIAGKRLKLERRVFCGTVRVENQQRLVI
jgi:hypothetical protein